MSFRSRENQLLRRQLEKQTEENLRLRRRIDELNRELGTLRADISTAVSPEVQAQFRRAAETRTRFALRNYLAYLLACLRATSLWALWQHLLTLARRYRVLTTTFRIITAVITWVETSTFFLLYMTIFLLTGLPLLLGSIVMLIVGVFQHHRCNAELAETLSGRQIYVCVAERAAFAEDSYFRGFVHDLAVRENCAVIVVSPFFWRSIGLSTRRGYVTMRREGDGIYLIRRHYYFSLRRHILRPNSERVTVLY